MNGYESADESEGDSTSEEIGDNKEVNEQDSNVDDPNPAVDDPNPANVEQPVAAGT